MDKLKSIQLQRIIRRRTSIPFWLCIIIGVFLIIVGFYLDLNIEFKTGLYQWVGKEIKNKDLYMALIEWKNGLNLNAETACSVILTIDTILAAAVIFFYSAIDNQKAGIPHRIIMAYTFGSCMVPCLFSIAMILIPIMYLGLVFNLSLGMWMCIVVSYTFQMLIIILTLLSTSYDYSLRAICYAEIRQFEYMPSISEEKQKYVWAYQVRHMEQVMKSDDLSAEKSRIISLLLKVPFYKKKTFYGHKEEKSKMYCINKKDLYDFYYMNINSIFHSLNGDGEEQEKMYQILYAFLDELREIYIDVVGIEAKKNCLAIENYRCIISAVINAVVEAKGQNSMHFLLQVIQRHILFSNTFKSRQINLYICYIQFIYYTYKNSENESFNYSLDLLYELINLYDWEVDILENVSYYEEYWKIWGVQVAVRKRDIYIYFWNMISVLKGERIDASPLGYITIYDN